MVGSLKHLVFFVRTDFYQTALIQSTVIFTNDSDIAKNFRFNKDVECYFL